MRSRFLPATDAARANNEMRTFAVGVGGKVNYLWRAVSIGLILMGETHHHNVCPHEYGCAGVGVLLGNPGIAFIRHRSRGQTSCPPFSHDIISVPVCQRRRREKKTRREQTHPTDSIFVLSEVLLLTSLYLSSSWLANLLTNESLHKVLNVLICTFSSVDCSI